jgi:GNAT superfamily N-acetyltransferase
MRYGDDDTHLDLLAVAPPYRRAGVGRQLLERLQKCAIVAGTVGLEVREERKGPSFFTNAWGIARSLIFPVIRMVVRRCFEWGEISRAARRAPSAIQESCSGMHSVQISPDHS